MIFARALRVVVLSLTLIPCACGDSSHERPSGHQEALTEEDIRAARERKFEAAIQIIQRQIRERPEDFDTIIGNLIQLHANNAAESFGKRAEELLNALNQPAPAGEPQ